VKVHGDTLEGGAWIGIRFEGIFYYLCPEFREYLSDIWHLFNGQLELSIFLRQLSLYPGNKISEGFWRGYDTVTKGLLQQMDNCWGR
jgi:hypothetical protein